MRFLVALREVDADLHCVMIPDLPGCRAVGRNPEQAILYARRAIGEHCRMLACAGEPMPEAQPLERHTPLPDFFEEATWTYPVLVYFRSQHDNESWLSALTAVLDTCALVIGAVEGVPRRVAELTFAMARHAVVDISIMFDQPPEPPQPDRLPDGDRAALMTMLRAGGCKIRDDADATARVDELRRMYEPYVNALSRRLVMPLPSWRGVEGARDNWQKSRWR